MPSADSERVFDALENGTAVVVPCSGAKLAHAAPAGELYTGQLHRLARRAADALGGRVLILSALHGLLQLDELVEPYDVQVGDDRAVAPDEVAAQARQLGVRRVIALTPKRYTALLADALGAELVDARLASASGIGVMRARLAAICRSADASADADADREVLQVAADSE
jgi:hypothetical protein